MGSCEYVLSVSAKQEDFKTLTLSVRVSSHEYVLSVTAKQEDFKTLTFALSYKECGGRGG